MIVTIGRTSVRLTVADGGTTGPDAGSDRGPDGRLGRFTGHGGRPPIDLTVTRLAAPSWEAVLTPECAARTQHIVREIKGRFPFIPVLFSSHGRAAIGDLSLPLPEGPDCEHVSVIPYPGFLLTVDHRTGRAEALVRIADGRDRDASLIPALQGALALCAPDHGALMLHAASLVIDGGGYLFIGNSGAGKSTIAGAVDPAMVLSDDGSWCARTDTGYALFPTPFCQLDHEPAARSSVPLVGMFFLEQGAQDRIVELSPGRAMTMLLSNYIHFFRFMSRGPARRAFRIVEDLCRRCPASTLVFTRDFNPNHFFRTLAHERKEAV
jgi:hypothetical protein